MDIILKDTNSSIILSDDIFNVPFNMSLIHQVVVSFRHNCRQGSVSQKSRSEVRGSNKKPWKQKGTGRARSGSIKSPIWRSGGVTFASKPKKYYSKINKKVYLNSLKIVLSELYRLSRFYVFNKIEIDKPKTKKFLEKFNFLDIRKLLIINDNFNRFLFLSTRNLFSVKIINVDNINILDLVKCRNVIFTLKSIKKFEDKCINVQ